jgi:class 3 adenylate cyclase
MNGEFALRVARVRHDLHNSIGQIHGFSEMWIEDFDIQGRDDFSSSLGRVHQIASRMSALTAQTLQPAEIEAGRANLPAVQQQLSDFSREILEDLKTLRRKSKKLDEVFTADLARMESAAHKALEVARSAMVDLLNPQPANAAAAHRSQPLLPELISGRPDPQPTKATLREGRVLVVDDLEENRELLSRRLSKLGYTVREASSGEEVLGSIRNQTVDLILLDILMPGIDGLEVLRRLKSDPALRHIPVVMLSSEDQLDTVVRCISLGADDFLPKPFNSTLLMARVESSLSRKRLRDHEAALLERVQAEQAISERLLLNILPRPIADRLKAGERTIADSFPNVTVLFTDFVDFTRLSSSVTPDLLVTRLNGIFSAFDRLCEQHGLEKIKMIGDGYMAVGGLPNARPDHAHIVANVALAMQTEASGFSLGHGRPCRMRIGINSGPVVAGVIGTRKFAYDLWGDTVNLASRMESCAPSGGILVTESTFALLKSEYNFKPGKLVRVKGKGQVVSYFLLGRKGQES